MTHFGTTDPPAACDAVGVSIISLSPTNRVRASTVIGIKTYDVPYNRDKDRDAFSTIVVRIGNKEHTEAVIFDCPEECAAEFTRISAEWDAS